MPSCSFQKLSPVTLPYGSYCGTNNSSSLLYCIHNQIQINVSNKNRTKIKLEPLRVWIVWFGGIYATRSIKERINKTIMKLWHHMEEGIKQPEVIMLKDCYRTCGSRYGLCIYSWKESAAPCADVPLICIIGTPLTFLDWAEGSRCLLSSSPVTATDGHPLSPRLHPLPVYSPHRCQAPTLHPPSSIVK